MHDYRPDSGENVKPEPFPVRRIKVEDYLDDFFFDQEYVSLIGTSRDGKGQVVDMDLGRVIVTTWSFPACRTWVRVLPGNTRAGRCWRPRT